jgi:hypothetical protein
MVCEISRRILTKLGTQIQGPNFKLKSCNCDFNLDHTCINKLMIQNVTIAADSKLEIFSPNLSSWEFAYALG